MGQYHYVCNLDRHEYLHPHRHGDGLKLMEFGQSGDGGTMTALTVLLSASNGRGGGDYHGDPEPQGFKLTGRWAGDRIAIIGDYEEPEDVPGFTDNGDTPWTDEDRKDRGLDGRWRCISNEVHAAMAAAGESRRTPFGEV